MSVKNPIRQKAMDEGKARFFDGKPRRRKNHVAERYTGTGGCVTCAGEYYEKCRQTPKSKMKDNIRAAARRREMTYEEKIIRRAKDRAKQNGWTLSLKKEDVRVPQLCPVLGIPLHVSSLQRWSNNSASIDRIDNEKGYTPDNIKIISWRANKLKNNATIKELKAILSYMEQYEKGATHG